MECNYCDRVFRSCQAVEQHEDAVHSYRCDHCNFTSREEEDLEQHVDNEHTIWRECDYCNDTFDDEDDLRRHMDDEHMVWHMCDICPDYGRSSRFQSSRALEQHKGSAAGHQNYCRPCKRSFMNQNNLNQVRALQFLMFPHGSRTLSSIFVLPLMQERTSNALGVHQW